jgi:mannose-1-phosphate guanylyltransferase/phosphomannomutase
VEVTGSVLLDNAYLGEAVRLHGSVIGRSCDIRRGATCEVGVVLGDETFVGEEAVLRSGVKVYPFKTVEARAIVNTSLVWESRGVRSIFGVDGVRGLSNVDITPELATRVAMAFGSTLAKGSTVMTSRDSSRSARMLKRAMMAGFNAVGVNVLDLEVASIPLTRFATRQPTAAAGVTVRLDPADPQNVVVRFFDTDGNDLGDDARRKVERLVDREDFRRVIPSEIGDIGFPPRVLEHYAAAVSATVDLAAIRARRPKAVIDYAYGSASFVMPDVLAKLGAEVLAVNPYASTAGLLHAETTVQAANLAELVRASHADVGALLSPDGTRLTIVDDRGRILDGTQALLAVLRLVGPYVDGDRVALPVHASRHATVIARAAGLEVDETAITPSALVAAASLPGVGFAATDDGGFILPGLLAAFDGAAMFVKLLELLSLTDRPLSAVVDDLPTVHLVHRDVFTPWDQKGTVMRSLVERTERELVLVDGVKVLHGDDWVLATPDATEPVTHLWAEADDDAAAQRLVEEYARRIGELIQ